MKVAKLNKTYKSDPDQTVSNEYDTSHYQLYAPGIMIINGLRGAGKTFLASKYLIDAMKSNIYDRIYCISSTWNSNKGYFGKYIDEDDVYDADRDAIDNVIRSVESDRDEFEQYLQDKKEYDEFLMKLKNKSITDEETDYYESKGFLDEEFIAPKYKYKTVRAPQSLLIMDDIVGSQALMKSNNNNNILNLAVTNRHVAPLQEPYKNRSACGLAIILLTQAYRTRTGGIAPPIRQNCTQLVLFANKSKPQVDLIKSELCSIIDGDKFDKAFAYATSEKHGSLLIDFKSKCPTMQFRKGLNELIMFPDDECACKCKNKLSTKTVKPVVGSFNDM